MKVYEFKGFPNPLRVRIALEEKGLSNDVDFIQVNVPEGEHRQPAFLEKNPDGLVPALETKCGNMLSECSAIIEYLDHLTGDRELTGKTPAERGLIHMMQRKVENGLMDAVGAYYHFATEGLGPDIETYQNVDWGLRRRQSAIDTMRWIDELLGENNYIVADRFTIVDITAYAGLIFAGFAKIEVPEECRNLKAWRARMDERQSVQQAAA